MAGKHIFIVYDPTVEDNVSLSKFIGIILEKAKFPLDHLAPISIKDFGVLFEREPENIKTVICLNKTYSSVSIKLGSFLKEPTHKFFTRTYKDLSKGILLLGLMSDVNSIFTDDATKKKAWGQLQAYQKDYASLSSGTQSEDDDLPPVIKSSAEVQHEEEQKALESQSVKKVEPESPPKVEETPVENPVVKAKTTRKTATKKVVTPEPVAEPVVESKTGLTHQELEDFYLKVKPILDAFFALGGK